MEYKLSRDVDKDLILLTKLGSCNCCYHMPIIVCNRYKLGIVSG